MKYKCIKDFWMEGESSETGHTPAFAKGEIYEFYRLNGCDDLITDADNHKFQHGMPKYELDDGGHFELIEECNMTTMKWEEGKTYRIKPDRVKDFESRSPINARIINVLGTNSFTVERVSDNIVNELKNFKRSAVDITHWFNPSEIRYFELVEDTQVETPPQTSYKQDIVIKWLDKLHYVLENDRTVGVDLRSNDNGISIDTDHGDIYGATNVYEFVNVRYEKMQNEKAAERKQKLLDKRAELELELAKIKQELGE